MSESGSNPPGGPTPSDPPSWGAPPPPPPQPPPGWQQAPPPPPGQGYGAPPPPPPGWGPGPAAYGQPSAGYGGAGYGGVAYAEWWQRLVAAIIDGLLVGIPMAILSTILGLNDSFGAGSVLPTVVAILYAGFLNGGEKGQTVGKMVMNIQVRHADTGGPIGTGPGLLRALVYQGLFLLCVLPGIINGLSPLWDQRKQAWHDKAVSSVVVAAPR